jgi:hypothetical protein
MLGEAIAGRALGDAGRRALPTEQAGPRPAGVRPDEADRIVDEARTMRATKP